MALAMLAFHESPLCCTEALPAVLDFPKSEAAADPGCFSNSNCLPSSLGIALSCSQILLLTPSTEKCLLLFSMLVSSSGRHGGEHSMIVKWALTAPISVHQHTSQHKQLVLQCDIITG